MRTTDVCTLNRPLPSTRPTSLPSAARAAGENRASRRASHFDARRARGTRACSSPGRAEPFASDTPVAASSLQRGKPWGNPTLSFGRRQDRFRGGLVKGVRIPDPECLPSTGATCAASRAETRGGHVAFMSARRSRDEDRRASMNPPPFCHEPRPCAYAPERRGGQAPVHAPSCERAGFRPARRRRNASLSPRAACRLLQIR